jgi:sensor histidine kinase regulating citrate/malate metabolism
MRFDPRRWSLARQVLALLTAALIVVVATAVLAAYLQARRSVYSAARKEVMSVARTVAASPTVTTALAAPDPAATLQPYAEQVRTSTGTDFVVIMNPDGIRYSHPDPRQLGGRFLGHTAPAVTGQAFTETYTGTLGPSVRAVAPIQSRGTTIGLVAVGIKQEAVGRDLSRQVPTLLVSGLIAFAAAAAGAWLLSRRLRRQTHDLGPQELSRLYEFYDAVLHAVREGLLLLDREGRLRLINDEGRRLLGLPGDAIGRSVRDLALPADVLGALLDDGPRVDDVRLSDDRVLVVSRMPARWQGRELGSVVTLRDHTDLLALSGELDSVRGFAEALRSQAHEAANRLHTVVALIELGHTERALEFATAGLREAQSLTDRVVDAVHEPVLAALLLGKAAEANERGVELRLAEDLDVPDAGIDGRDLVTIVGNLIDNAIDAAAAAPGPRSVRFGATVDPASGLLLVRVGDSGAGVAAADADRVFDRGWSTKPGRGGAGGRGLGLALVRQAVERHGGSIDLVGTASTGPAALEPALAGGSSSSPAGVSGSAGEVSASAGAIFVVRLPIRVSDPITLLEPATTLPEPATASAGVTT